MVSSLLLALLIVLCFAPVVQGASEGSAPTVDDIAAKVIVSSVSYPIVTDYDQLPDLAVQQYYADVRSMGSSAANELSIVATQLSGITTYADGSEKKDYVATVFMLLQENGQPLTRAALAANSRSSQSSHHGYKDTNVVHTCYYNVMTQSGTKYYRISSISTVANDAGTDPTYVTKFHHEIYTKDVDNPNPYLVTDTITNPVSGQAYTLTNYYAVYVEDNDNCNVYSAAGPITYSDGYKWNYYMNIVIL